jgi:hypothetical protein
VRRGCFICFRHLISFILYCSELSREFHYFSSDVFIFRRGIILWQILLTYALSSVLSDMLAEDELPQRLNCITFPGIVNEMFDSC